MSVLELDGAPENPIAWGDALIGNKNGPLRVDKDTNTPFASGVIRADFSGFLPNEVKCSFKSEIGCFKFL